MHQIALQTLASEREGESEREREGERKIEREREREREQGSKKEQKQKQKTKSQNKKTRMQANLYIYGDGLRWINASRVSVPIWVHFCAWGQRPRDIPIFTMDCLA